VELSREVEKQRPVEMSSQLAAALFQGLAMEQERYCEGRGNQKEK
jgi:hypothetical protein